MPKSKPPPFDFILDYLPDQVVIKAQFGMHYVYLNKRLVLMLRKTDNGDGLNGIFVVSRKEHHQSLESEIPALTKFIIGSSENYDSNWRYLPEDHDDFETAAVRLCELISRADPRIGKATKGGAML